MTTTRTPTHLTLAILQIDPEFCDFTCSGHEKRVECKFIDYTVGLISAG